MSNNTIKTIERNGRTYAKITDLKIWDKNPREIKPEKLRLLCEDLKRDIDIVENGQFKPLIVMKNGIVIGGNMRLQAMRRLGMAEAWVSVINTTDEKRAFDIATRDNMMYGYYDEDQTAEVIAELGIDIKTLERLSIASENNETILSELVQPEKDPEVEEDEAPEVKEEPKSKLGEVYVLGGGAGLCVAIARTLRMSPRLWTEHWLIYG
nr:MAG TPA: ParB protein [Caudoviricetes sp.]